jgi:hypothetical protein
MPDKQNDHARAIQLWVDAFKIQFGVVYVFKGGRDGKAIKTLLQTMTPEQIVATAQAAWKAPQGPAFWNCNRRSMTLFDFEAAINKINVELAKTAKPVMKAF